MKKDNGGEFIKLALRTKLLEQIESPRVLETNGGKGVLGHVLYLDFPGVVFEKDAKKIPHLIEMRPSWAVYEGDCEKAMLGGIGFHHRPNFVDVDPYGSPWDILRAVFRNADKLDDRVGVAVTDGLKRFAMLGRAWKSKDLYRYARTLGNTGVCAQWSAVVQDLFRRVVEPAGYELKDWVLRASGHGGQMTNYAAVVERKKDSLPEQGV